MEMPSRLQICFDRLYRVWDELGLDKVERKEREEEVMMHVQRLLNNIAGQEEAACAEILHAIDNNKALISALSDELDKTCEMVSAGNDGAILGRSKQAFVL